MKIDLRTIKNNDTYIINIIGGYSCFEAIYHYNYGVFTRVLYSGDLLIYPEFESTLRAKEFKEIIAPKSEKITIGEFVDICRRHEKKQDDYIIGAEESTDILSINI